MVDEQNNQRHSQCCPFQFWPMRTLTFVSLNRWFWELFDAMRTKWELQKLTMRTQMRNDQICDKFCFVLIFMYKYGYTQLLSLNIHTLTTRTVLVSTTVTSNSITTVCMPMSRFQLLIILLAHTDILNVCLMRTFNSKENHMRTIFGNSSHEN